MSGNGVTAAGGGISSDQLQQSLDALQDKMNAKNLAMYTYAANSQFADTMASTCGNLSLAVAKDKPQVS